MPPFAEVGGHDDLRGRSVRQNGTGVLRFASAVQECEVGVRAGLASLKEYLVGAAAWRDVRGPDEGNGVAEFLFGVVDVAL